MSSDTQSNRPLSEEELQDLVASSDAGGRNPVGNVGIFLAVVAAIWSIFQVVLASPISNYVLPGSVVNNARQFHLAFAMFLAFAAYPAFRTDRSQNANLKIWAIVISVFLACWAAFAFYIAPPSSSIQLPGTLGSIPIPSMISDLQLELLEQTQPSLFFLMQNAMEINVGIGLAGFFLFFWIYGASPKNYVPIPDWIMGIVGTFVALYGYFFYDKIVNAGGLADDTDKLVALVGLILLFEAARRALGPAMAIIATIFLAYVFFGSSEWVPEVIRWKGASLKKAMSHMWITSEGVFGIALGVSTKFVFLFVLFGALLDKAGAGNYFIKMAFGALGHLRGGPAKAAVVGSAATGLISGSSIANVVTTGTFTIPLMKRVGFSSEQAGSVEVASSVNGQIMPPVMGAAAFLMVEYVGISYVEVITHAFLPAAISYIALVYIVHLEAVKRNMPTLGDRDVHLARTVVGMLSFFVVFAGLCYSSQFPVDAVTSWAPSAAGLILSLIVCAIYVVLLYLAAQVPDLEPDDPNAKEVTLPVIADIYKAGLHYLLPIIVLVYFLMIEQKSPGLSAFWATALLFVILLTQKPLKAVFRGESDVYNRFIDGVADLWQGLIDGARNMIGIALATATAGVIVGTVTLTGVGQVMADLVEFLSGGNLILMLIMVGILSLILGMGLPTTANYIVVSSLMAGVVVELGAQSGLIVPLIAVHLFVFYFGIMADVTPPVGLASFAAAAVSGGDAIKTGFTAFFYSLRTVALPFVFIFNTDLLLIDVTWVEGIIVAIFATIAILVFTAGTMGYFLTHSRIYESIALIFVAFALFRPDFFMDRISPPFQMVEPAAFEETIGQVPPGTEMRLVVSGPDFDTLEMTDTTVVATVGSEDGGAARVEALGLILIPEDGVVKLDEPFPGTPLSGDLDIFDYYGDEAVRLTSVSLPSSQPPKQLVYIPAMILLGLIALLQRGRAARREVLA